MEESQINRLYAENNLDPTTWQKELVTFWPLKLLQKYSSHLKKLEDDNKILRMNIGELQLEIISLKKFREASLNKLKISDKRKENYKKKKDNK